MVHARTELGSDGPALADLAAEVAAAETALDRFQQFLNLIDQAHQAETAPRLEATLAVVGFRGRVQVAHDKDWARPADAVPLLREALQRYDILEREDWRSALEGGFLGPSQVELIRRTAYEELLWLADDILRRQQGHESTGHLRATPDGLSRT